jgi:SpoVK/Ycf46/Vps4 family AAA+-type ATPase
MAKFNGDYKNEYAMLLMGEYFRNSLTYFRGEVHDSNYFRPLLRMADERTIEQAIYDFFGGDDLVKCDVGRFCENEGRNPRNGRKYGHPEMFYHHDDPEDTIQELWNNKEHREKCRKLLIGIVDGFIAARTKAAEGDVLKGRFEELRRFFKFTDLEMDAIKYAFIRSSTAFESDPYRGRRSNNDLKNERLNFFAMCIDHSVAEVRELRNNESRLRKYDFLDDDLDIRGSIQEFLNGEDDKPLQGRFYRKAKADDVLPWDFYGKALQRHGTLLKRLISSKKGGKGVNILLYGEPGTGKTSFAMTLAKELGLDVYEIMHGEEDGRNTSLNARLIGVQVCNEQIPMGKGMMVVDEADQILRTGGGGGLFGFFFCNGDSSEKGQVNSMLDSIRCPTVWISNASADSMADSVRRRFDYSIYFKKLTHAMRVNIWRNNIKKLKLGRLIPPSDIDALAAKYATSAGGITMVLKNLKEMAPKRDEVPDLLERLMEPHCELMGTETSDDLMLPAKDYSLEGLNLKGDVELGRITDAVRNFFAGVDEGKSVEVDRPRMNLLLWGPPGTGKTEFVKYLAKAVNRKVVVKMGSDLLSMWVGGTEKNIRRAFEEAEEDNAILFLDEIDGIVQDRSGAQRSWEVTQVNELLHRMENFKGVMVGATNFMDNLDAAIMRRFTFKLQFDYLDAEGKRLFFERMFKAGLTEAEAIRLAGIPNLAPGDFRTVRQSLYYLGGAVTNETRLNELEKESSLKKGTSRRVGF